MDSEDKGGGRRYGKHQATSEAMISQKLGCCLISVYAAPSLPVKSSVSLLEPSLPCNEAQTAYVESPRSQDGSRDAVFASKIFLASGSRVSSEVSDAGSILLSVARDQAVRDNTCFWHSWASATATSRYDSKGGAA